MQPLTCDIVPDTLKPFAGNRFYLDDQFARADYMSFSLVNECLSGPLTSFGQISRNGLLLNDQTRKFLYEGSFGFVERVGPTDRFPLLAKYIQRAIGQHPGSLFQRVAALSQSLRSLPDLYPIPPAFLYGESDEQTILKGGGHCSCKGRLLTALCQFMGLEARPVMFWTYRDRERDPELLLGGHTVAEVFIDGRWCFFDPQVHVYASDGQRGFSIDELKQDPDLITRMPESVTRDMHPVKRDPIRPGDTPFVDYRYRYFSPLCPTQITRHDYLGDYEVRWTWATDEFRQRQRHDFTSNQQQLLSLAERGELTDDVYHLKLDGFRKRFNIINGQLSSQDLSAS